MPMSFALATFAFALLQALGIHARVMARDGLIQRPEFASKAVLSRLRSGVRALEAYLRRVLILMALEMEHDLVAIHHPENLARAKALPPRVRKPVFVIYPASYDAAPTDFTERFSGANIGAITPVCHRDAITSPPLVVPIGSWMDRLDHLHAIAKDPIAKARRLAFSLARSRHGFLMAPPEHPRRLRRWGTEPSAIYDAMGFQIMQKSRSRPPPLPPPRRGPKPTITVFW